VDFTSGPTFPELCEIVADVGFEAISAGITPDLDISSYQDALGSAGIDAAPGYFSATLEDPAARAEFVPRAEALARVHSELGLSEIFVAAKMDPAAPRVATPGQGVDPDGDRLAKIAESLDLVCAEIRKHGVMPCLHQHVGTWIESEDEVEWLLGQLPADELALGPDTGHLAWAGVDPVALIRRHHERVRGLHVKDVRLQAAAQGRAQGDAYRDVVKSGLWVEPGRGDLDLKAAVQAVGTATKIWAIIEVDRPDLPSPIKSARACQAWALEAARW
jgi:inosose dehydratase